jgi:histidinol dehydrogenase
MMRIFDVQTARSTILRRSSWDEMDAPESLLTRIGEIFGERLTPDAAVRRILDDVRQRGDAAVIEWARRIDRVALSSLVVRPGDVADAYTQLDPQIVDALRAAACRIEEFHRRQPVADWIQRDGGGILGQLVRPIERVGIYTPGGSAPLPSSVLMTAIPGRVAGVPHLSLITPPLAETGLPHPAILVAADIAGVERIYIAGGAQAIAALAFGTQSIPRVDKICGPGGIFTTLAKRQVYGLVGIDGLPGPTETLVIADESTNPAFVAADLLAQAEHDVLACAILLTPSRRVAEEVQAAVMAQLEELGRSEIIVGSLSRGSAIVVTESLEQAFELANAYAPEHLCLLVEEPDRYLDRVRNAGGVFLGERSFEVLGDYVAGPSHVMPTGGTARFASPINVWDFVKLMSVIGLSEQAMQTIGPVAATLAHAEGLTAHAAAVERRLEVHTQ